MQNLKSVEGNLVGVRVPPSAPVDLVADEGALKIHRNLRAYGKPNSRFVWQLSASSGNQLNLGYSNFWPIFAVALKYWNVGFEAGPGLKTWITIIRQWCIFRRSDLSA